MKIVVNRCFGGFSVSKAIYDELGIDWDGYGFLDNKAFGITSENYDAFRADPKLIAAIEKVGLDLSKGEHASLKIVDVPDGTDWEIGEYDGREWVAEKHNTW